MVYPIGYGRGSAGLDGTGFQLLAIIFTEFFGVTLAQLVGAIAPSIQVCSVSCRPLSLRFVPIEMYANLENEFLVGRDVVQFSNRPSAVRVLWCHHPIPGNSALATVALPVEPLGQDH